MNHIVTPEYLAEQGLSPTAPERFWAKVNKNGPIPKHKPELGPCWEWTAWKKPGKWNYPSMGRCDGTQRHISAHRVSWILHFGPIPEGMNVLHKCDYPPCTNPNHLFLGTFKENTHDMMRKGRMNVGNHAGEHNGRATVTWDIVRQMRAMYIPRKVTKKQIAATFSVPFSKVKAIVEHKTWNEPSLPC